MNVAPSPTSLSTTRLPPCSFTIFSASGRPRPTPVFFPCVIKGSNTLSCNEGGIQRTMSLNEMLTESSSGLVEIYRFPPSGIASQAFLVIWKKAWYNSFLSTLT